MSKTTGTLSEIAETIGRLRSQLDSLCARMIAERQDMAGQLAAMASERDEARGLASERYQECEELRAALGEPNQQAPSVTAALRARLAECERDRDEARAALDEREADMHMRIRAGYDKTVADAWRAEVERLRARVIEAFQAGMCVGYAKPQGGNATYHRETAERWAKETESK